MEQNDRFLNNFLGATWVGDVYGNTGKIGSDGTWKRIGTKKGERAKPGQVMLMRSAARRRAAAARAR